MLDGSAFDERHGLVAGASFFWTQFSPSDISWVVDRRRVIQGRWIGLEDVTLIRDWLEAHPESNRTRLSRHLCECWNWRNLAGRLKDMACRSLLLKLEGQGQIRLPPRKTASVNGLRNHQAAPIPHDQSPLEGPLRSLQPVAVEPIKQSSAQGRLFRFLLQRYHYLGHRNCVGENLKYLAWSSAGRPLACLLFGSAAWKAAARDQWIGWSTEQRRRHLGLVTNNTRCLVLPWATGVPHLASHLLGLAAVRLSADWQQKYGHPIYLLESFVEARRFVGTCYRAAGWIEVGRTTGRSRNDRDFQLQVPPKAICLKPLVADFRQRLAA